MAAITKEDVPVVVAADKGRQLIDPLSATDVIEIATIFKGFETAQGQLAIARVGQKAMGRAEVIGCVALHFEVLTLRRLIDAQSEQCRLVNQRRLPNRIQIGA